MTPEDELHTRFASLVEADAGTREAFVRALPDDARRALITWVGVELATMPVPLGIDAVERFLPMRNSLERIGALAELADGKPDRMLRACRAAWIHEGDHASYLELLRAHGDRTEAREVALMVLEQRWASDRALDGLVAEVIGIPEGVRVAVHAIAESPSCARFDDIVRFAPTDRLDDWMRFTMRLLLRLGTEPTFVLEQLSAHGFSHALAELLESGRLAPHVIAARAQLAPQEERARYLAYAARSAAVRGEAFATARWLREASIAQAHADELKETHRFVMLHATPEIRDVLARARIVEAPSTRC